MKSIHYLFGSSLVLTTAAIIPIAGIGFIVPKLPLLALCSILGLVMSFSVLNKESFCNSTVMKIIAAFFVIAILSPLWSVFPAISIFGTEPRFEGAVFYAVLSGAVIFSWAFVRSNRSKILLNSLFASNAIAVTYALMQFLNLDPLVNYWRMEAFLGRTFSVLGQPNFLALFILLTYPFICVSWHINRMET